MKRIRFYYDGFNFYGGLKEAKLYQYYWIDIVKFSSELVKRIKNSTVEKVFYFSTVPTWNSAKAKRHKKFYAVNIGLNPGIFTVINGKFSKKTIQCRAECQKNFTKYEEKLTDVNIAVKMLEDAQQGNCDIMCLVTGDNDLNPPLQLIRSNYPDIEIHVYCPPKRTHNQLGDYAHKWRKLGQSYSAFDAAKIPNELKANGWDHYIPSKWIR